MSTLNEIAKKVLTKGIVIKLVFPHKGKNNYVVLAQKKWLDVFGFGTNFADDDIIDIILEKKFDIDNIKISLIEYIGAPKDITLEDLISPSPAFQKLGEDFLLTNESYINNIISAIAKFKLNFKEYKSYHMDLYKQLNLEQMREVYYLRFFPNTVDNKNKDEIMITIENDVQEKFFLHSEQNGNLPNLLTIVPSLYVLGVDSNHINNEDARFINALKSRWFDLIDSERHKIVIDLNVQLDKLSNIDASDECIDESKKQILEYVDLLKGIQKDCLNNFTTVKEVVSYWPNIMQPMPSYVYEN
jgi:hypothetical protein